MAGFKITLKTSAGEIVEALESAIGRVSNFGPMFGAKDGPLSDAWADSRRTMFRTLGASNGTPWPAYTSAERRYYLPRKRAALYGSNRGESGRAHSIGKAGLLRFTTSPESETPGPMERLYPSMSDNRHPEYVWEPSTNSLTFGTGVPYASAHNRGGVTVTFRSNYGRGKSGKTVASYPLPRRPLIVFGPVFVEAVRDAMKFFAVSVGEGPRGKRGGAGKLEAGKRIGLTTTEVLGRIAAAKAVAA